MNQLVCFIRVDMGEGRREECGRPTTKLTDLCCPEHWRMVPRPLKQALVEANKLRSERERERKTMVAASDIVVFLSELKIQLPPAPKLERSGQLGPAQVGELVKVDAGPRVSKDSKLIIPGR